MRSRSAATPCNGLPAGGAGEDRLEKYIADNLLPWAAADFAPEEAGVVDEDTYVQQGRDLERAYSRQVIDYILGTLQTDTDLAMVGYPFTDEVSHQFMGLVTPTDIDGSPNPCYDVDPEVRRRPVHRPRHGHRVAIREGYIRSAYEDADEKLGARYADRRRPDDFAARTTASARSVVRGQREQGAVRRDRSTRRLAAREQRNASNCGAATTDLAKACWAGGTIQIYVNPALPAGITYAPGPRGGRGAFQNLTDPANPGKQS